MAKLPEVKARCVRLLALPGPVRLLLENLAKLLDVREPVTVCNGIMVCNGM